MRLASVFRLPFCLMLILMVHGSGAFAQEAGLEGGAATAAKVPEIADEPKTIDPVTLMPEPLRERGTVDLTDSSLRELVAWLQDEQGLVVLLDTSALDSIGKSASEPISDRLDDDPVYWLLNRLRVLGLDWYFEDDVVHVTSAEMAEERLATMPYNVGDLIDAGYDTDDLVELIEGTIETASWDSVGGPGSLMAIGDVLFIHQTQPVQRKIQGLLETLRRHGRQTFIYAPARHVALRQRLEKNVSVELDGTPLELAVENLSEMTGIEIRLDDQALRMAGIYSRQPMTLTLEDRKLATVLEALTSDLSLSWMLRDGVLYLTTPEAEEEFLKTAVYDVRDLCQDEAEADALAEAVQSQVAPTSWDWVGGPGSLRFAQPGTLVVCQPERVQMKVLDLLEAYRMALRSSKPREHDEVDPNEVITVYYRMHANVASHLSAWLPALVAPGTWDSGDPGTWEDVDKTGTGRIVYSPSSPELIDGGVADAEGEKGAAKQAVSRGVIIVTHTRAVHEEIAEMIRRIENGDATETSEAGMMPEESGGMGGFGGAFFNILDEPRP